MTSGICSLVGIAIARRKTDAERTAGSACVKADERLAAICACTAAVCCFRLLAVERFGPDQAEANRRRATRRSAPRNERELAAFEMFFRRAVTRHPFPGGCPRRS